MGKICLFARLKSGNVYLMDFDFMFVDKGTLDKISKADREISIARNKFIVPCVEHLLALKPHLIKYNPELRENKNWPDIVDLIRNNKVDSTDISLKSYA